MTNISVKIRVSGKVQGVYFRDSTRQQAEEHQLTGYARNLSDGSVDILLQGDHRGVAHVTAWIRAGGPPSARVDMMSCEPFELVPLSGFTTG